MEEIINYAKEFYKKLDFAHNIEHGKRVVKIAKIIMESEGGDPFLIEAGAWLHQFHDNLDEVQEFINTLYIDNELKVKLYEIVRCCRPKKINDKSSIEAKIVFDADAIEVISTYGIIRELFCNIKTRDKSWANSVSDTIKVQKDFSERLMTKTAIKLVEQDVNIINEFWDSYNNWTAIIN